MVILVHVTSNEPLTLAGPQFPHLRNEETELKDQHQTDFTAPKACVVQGQEMLIYYRREAGHLSGRAVKCLELYSNAARPGSPGLK